MRIAYVINKGLLVANVIREEWKIDYASLIQETGNKRVGNIYLCISVMSSTAKLRGPIIKKE